MEGILPKGPYPPCLRMADRTLLAGYPRYVDGKWIEMSVCLMKQSDDDIRLITHWGRTTHICVNNLTITGSDNDLSPGRYQDIIWTQCWDMVISTIRNELQWNCHQNQCIFNQESAFENVVWKKVAILSRPQYVNPLRPRQNGRHFADDIFKCIFLNESVLIPIKISMKFVPKGPINNIYKCIYLLDVREFIMTHNLHTYMHVTLRVWNVPY